MKTCPITKHPCYTCKVDCSLMEGYHINALMLGVPEGNPTATEIKARGVTYPERPFVIVESPYGGKDLERNIIYLRACLRDSWEKGENAFASHAFYPFFLRESAPEERSAGIEAGYWFWRFAKKIVFYTDYGVSPGMAAALSRARSLGRLIELRTIGELP